MDEEVEVQIEQSLRDIRSYGELVRSAAGHDHAIGLDAPPTWDDYRALLARSGRSSAYREAGNWALSVLSDILGASWLRRAAAEQRPPPLTSHLAHMAGHTVAMAEILELALRLQLLRGVGGRRKIRNDLVGNPNEGRTLHTGLQLNVMASAIRLGWDVELEPGGTQTAGPADVWIAAPTGDLLVEIRIRSEADVARDFRQAADAVHERLFLAGARYDAWIEGHLGRLPTDAELADIESCLVNWARARKGNPRWSRKGIELTVVPRAHAPGSLRSPLLASDTWERLAGALHEKAGQMQGSGAQWLRLVPLTGIFGMTAWGRQPLARKLADLAVAIDASLAEERPSGVVVSSAASLYPGDVAEEQISVGPAVGVRRPVAPLRARETLIVPLRDEGVGAVAAWVALANAERDWLQWALAHLALPPFEAVFA